MIWMDVPRWKGFYIVSDEGFVRSVSRKVVVRNSSGKFRPRHFRGQTLEPSHTSGYPLVTLSRPGRRLQIYVHDLVLQAFVGPKPVGFEVCHNNGNPLDARLKNLRYDTRSANSLDRFRHGTVVRQWGTQNKNAKLSKEDIDEIRGVAGIVSARYLSRQYGVSHATIGRIVRGLSYLED